MICTACRCPCRFAHTGLCRKCRELAHLPKMTRRPPRTAKRWLAPQYFDVRRARGLTVDQALLKSELLYRELRQILPGRVIHDWGLDNPYMFKHARRATISYILHNAALVKKPVQSVRPISIRKAVAA